jgi:hypothetical protein
MVDTKNGGQDPSKSGKVLQLAGGYWFFWQG